MKKKIIFNSFHPLAFRGGFEFFVIQIAAAYKKANPSHDVMILNSSFRWFAILNTIISVLIYRRKPLQINQNKYEETMAETCRHKLSWLTISPTKWRRILNECNTIYVKNEILDLLILRLIFLKSNARIVVGVHTPPIDSSAKSFVKKFRNYVYTSKLYKSLFKNVAIIHTLNHSDYKFYNELLPGKAIVKIPNFFDADAFRALANTQEYASSLCPIKNIVWIGRLTEEKGFSALIYIIEHCHDSNIVWHIIGDGDVNAKKRLSKLQRKGSNFIYHGPMKRTDLARFLSRATLHIVTSKCETFGYTILEAMSLNVPVVALCSAGAAEIIQDGCGEIVASENEMISFCKNYSSSSNHFPKKEPQIFDKYRYQNTSQKLISLF